MRYDLRVIGLLMLTTLLTPTYINPIADLRMGDPFVAKLGDAYYLTGTTRANGGFDAWRSTDLIDWRPIGETFDGPAAGWADGAFWAPELFEHGGRFYLTYSARSKDAEGTPRFRLGLAVADEPGGPYDDVAGPWLDDGHAAIDAHVFIDDDSTPYLYFARVGQQREPDGKLLGTIWGVRLTADLTATIGEPQELVVPEQAWELPADGLSICNEGPFIFRENGRYFMLFSAGHWADPYYAIGYAVADDPLGPWTKPADNPLAQTDAALGVSGPGHCSVTIGPGGDRFVVYHAHADPATPRGPRTVNLDRLTVTPDGKLKLHGPTRDPQPMP